MRTASVRSGSARTARMASALLGAAALLSAAPPPAPPGVTPANPLTRQLQFSACYVKEDVDRAWQLRLMGRMPDGPGMYVIIYNAAGARPRHAPLTGSEDRTGQYGKWRSDEC